MGEQLIFSWEAGLIEMTIPYRVTTENICGSTITKQLRIISSK
jgi:hypothetical protein